MVVVGALCATVSGARLDDDGGRVVVAASTEIGPVEAVEVVEVVGVVEVAASEAPLGEAQDDITPATTAAATSAPVMRRPRWRSVDIVSMHVLPEVA